MIHRLFVLSITSLCIGVFLAGIGIGKFLLADCPQQEFFSSALIWPKLYYSLMPPAFIWWGVRILRSLLKVDRKYARVRVEGSASSK